MKRERRSRKKMLDMKKGEIEKVTEETGGRDDSRRRKVMKALLQSHQASALWLG
jgi:hypothetical protein